MTTAILGLGAMGTALAGAVLGHDRVTVWNRSPGKATALAQRGATVATSVDDAIAASDVIVVCLVDYAAVDDVFANVTTLLCGKIVVNLTNGTPQHARDLAGRMQARGARYVDGGIMAVPGMIGSSDAFLLYSGDREAFDDAATVLHRFGAAHYVGTDAGLASLHDLALLAGMYGLFGGALHAMALAATEHVPATRFLALLGPWLTAMGALLPDLAARIDSGDHARDAMSNLAMQAAAIDNIATATREQGISAALIEPIARLMHERVAQGGGADEISGIVEILRGR